MISSNDRPRMKGRDCVGDTYCLPRKSFLEPLASSYRLPVYSMVTISPFLGLSVPLPLATIFLVTPIVLVDLIEVARKTA